MNDFLDTARKLRESFTPEQWVLIMAMVKAVELEHPKDALYVLGANITTHAGLYALGKKMSEYPDTLMMKALERSQTPMGIIIDIPMCFMTFAQQGFVQTNEAPKCDVGGLVVVQCNGEQVHKGTCIGVYAPGFDPDLILAGDENPDLCKDIVRGLNHSRWIVRFA